MRRTSTFALAAVVALAACQSRETPVRVEPVGLLVGLTSGTTLWIAPEGDSLRLVARKEGLLVPRDDGFWWVGTGERCSVAESSPDGDMGERQKFLHRRQGTYAVRAGGDAVVALDGTSCREAAREVPGADTSGAPTQGTECTVDTREVSFVSATALSAEARYTVTEYCSPGKYHTSGWNIVTGFDQQSRIKLRTLLSDSAWTSLWEQLRNDEGCGAAIQMLEDGEEEAAWAVRHQQGTWRATFWADGPIVCRGGSEMELTIPLPSTFTADAPLPIAWDSLRIAVPNVRDAAAAPGGRQLALLVGDTLSIADFADGRIERTVLRVPVAMSDGFVMLRWATATEAAKWSREIPALVAPVIQFRPAATRPH